MDWKRLGASRVHTARNGRTALECLEAYDPDIMITDIQLPQDIYIRYMNQLTTANRTKKGDAPMVCEGILNLCGTSSEEIIERTRKEEAAYYPDHHPAELPGSGSGLSGDAAGTQFRGNHRTHPEGGSCILSSPD